MTRTGSRLRSDRATTLIEAMVALAILLVGLLGMMQLQILGITSTSGARTHTQALQVARELAAALEQLAPDDPLLAHHSTSPDAPPSTFGHLLTGTNSVAADGFTAYGDSTPVHGATSNAALQATYGTDPVDGGPRFTRRWQVWQMETAASSGGVKAIAISVTYREPRMPGLREVVLLTQVANRGLSSAFAAAYR